MADRNAHDDEGGMTLEDNTVRNLHQRLLEGRPAARSQLAEGFLGDVRRILARNFPSIQSQHSDWIDDAATDGIMVYLNNPAKYDPQQGKLLPFLVGIATNKLRARRDTELPPASDPTATGDEGDAGHIVFVSIDEDAEDGESVGNRLSDQNIDIERDVITLLEDTQFIQWLRPRLADPTDRAVAQLLLDRATSTEEYATAVHLDPTTLSAKDLAQRAYNHKERMKKRLRRLYDAYSEGREVRSYNRRERPTDQST